MFRGREGEGEEDFSGISLLNLLLSRVNKVLHPASLTHFNNILISTPTFDSRSFAFDILFIFCSLRNSHIDRAYYITSYSLFDQLNRPLN